MRQCSGLTTGEPPAVLHQHCNRGRQWEDHPAECRSRTIGLAGLEPALRTGSWDFDANLQKRIRFAEARSLTVRLDASNILNHPTPANPNLDINSGTFGEITTK